MAKTKERPFIDATTTNLIIDIAKVRMRLKANGSSLRRLQTEVGNDKEVLDGLIDELTQRAVDENKLELPFGHTMESLFASAEKKDDSE
jgi:hypothetical protein